MKHIKAVCSFTNFVSSFFCQFADDGLTQTQFSPLSSFLLQELSTLFFITFGFWYFEYIGNWKIILLILFILNRNRLVDCRSKSGSNLGGLLKLKVIYIFRVRHKTVKKEWVSMLNCGHGKLFIRYGILTNAWPGINKKKSLWVRVAWLWKNKLKIRYLIKNWFLLLSIFHRISRKTRELQAILYILHFVITLNIEGGLVRVSSSPTVSLITVNSFILFSDVLLLVKVQLIIFFCVPFFLWLQQVLKGLLCVQPFFVP